MDNKERANNIRERVRRLSEIGIQVSVYAIWLDIPLKKMYNFINGKINFAKDQEKLDELEELLEELENIFFHNDKND